MGTSESGSRFDLVNEILEEALELPSAARKAFVENRCSADADLRNTLFRLIARFDDMGGFMETPALRPPEIREGDVLLDRFRIVRKLGEGGMGSVFLAEDSQLGEVALKTIRSDLRGVPEAIGRFRAEISLSRGLAQHNICPIFELFEFEHPGGGGVFFTMKYLRGETLAQRISNGPIPLAEALRLACGIAAGLDALHSEGIVHRDFKPGNVILTPDRDGVERPVITDFGLAKSVGNLAVSQHTAPAQILGSADYMAPEQFLSAAVTPAADIYSFGVVLFEMIAGQRPFPNEDLLRSALRRNTEDAPLLTTVAPNVPAEWVDAVAKALARDPMKRPASAGAVVANLLQRHAVGLRLPAVTHRVTRRTAMILAGSAFSVAGIFGFARYIKQPGTLPNTPTLMLIPVTHQTSERDREVAGAVDSLLRTQLQQSAWVRILPDEKITDAWARISGNLSALPKQPEPQTVRQIALRTGTALVLFGNLGSVGDAKILHLSLEFMGKDTGHAERTWTQSFTASGEADLPRAVYDGAAWLRRTAGESAQLIESHHAHPEDLTTASWQALLEFQRGNEAWIAGQSEVSLLHLRTALDLDPRFALAAARMADLLEAQYRHDEGMPYYSAAAEIIRQKNLTDRESLRIRGLFSLDTGQFAEAEQIFSRYCLEYPGDTLPLFHKATAVDRLGRSAEALQLAETASKREPASYPYIMKGAVLLLNGGQPDAAEAACQAAAALKPGDWTDLFRSALAMSRANLPGVWQSLEKMRTEGSPSFRSRAYAFEACLRAEQSNWERAAQLLAEGLDFDSGRSGGAQAVFSKRRLMAQLYLRRGHADAARDLCHELLAGKPGYEDKMWLGCLLAEAGDIGGAAACRISGLPAWPVYSHWVERLKGEIALARGAAREGLALMQSAPSTHTKYEWPLHVARAALAAGDAGALRRCLLPLLRNPGSHWIQADTTGPGFMSWALEASTHADLQGPDILLAKSLRELLLQSI